MFELGSINCDIDENDLEDRRYRLFGYIFSLISLQEKVKDPYVDPDIPKKLLHLADEVSTLCGIEAVEHQTFGVMEFIEDGYEEGDE